MRKFIRNNIINLLKTVGEALNEGLSSDTADINGILAECRGAIDAIAKMMSAELSPGRFSRYEGTLSELDEALETLLTDIDDIDEINKLLEVVFGRLDRLGAELERETEIKTEVVFFPYKASMWDSMESIWRAACADERCAVSVVPIPYYDRDPRGNLAAMYYEGDQYPDDVSVIHYNEFDMKAVAPDIAYIHNPYDERNLVTSVHPDYYSRKLKETVKTLIYVPYFASMGLPSPIFAGAAAGLAADVIVAASLPDAEQYLNAGARCEVVPLGSPKIDKIINMTTPDIPKDWACLEGKKIFFLNTSLASLLMCNEAYFDKLRALFSLFEGRRDIALLWRPHPLTKQTIKSMRPHLANMYTTLEKAIIGSDFGVVDLTPDMETAIAVSHAYLGDGSSSLVYLYALTGKPLYLLNFELPISPSEEELPELLATDILTEPCVNGDQAWAFSTSLNALYRIDMGTGKAAYVSSVPDEKIKAGLYGKPVKTGSKLLLPPILARHWAEYDIQTGVWKKYPVPAKRLPRIHNGGCFFTALDGEDFAIFAPMHSTAFVKYNKRTGALDYYSNRHKNFGSLAPDVSQTAFAGVSGLIGDSLYFPCFQSNAVFEINVRSMAVKAYSVGKPGCGYGAIAFDGERFWLTKFFPNGSPPHLNRVVCWDKKTGEVKEFTLEPVLTGYPFSRPVRNIAFFDGYIWVFQCGTGAVFKIDPKTEKISLVETGLDDGQKNPYYLSAQAPSCLCYTDNKSVLTAFSYRDNSFLSIRAETGKFEKKKLVVEGIADMRRDTKEAPPYLRYENAYLTPAGYIDKISSGEIPGYSAEQAGYYRAINENSDGTCGEKIHAFAMRKMPSKPPKLKSKRRK